VALPPPSPSSAALITGASSGIGTEIARELARSGHAVILVARREERLREIAAELGQEHGIRTEVLSADLGDAAARDGLATSIEALGLDVEILVNNAGYGDNARLNSSDRERLLAMVRLNCEGLLDLQARYSPSMVTRRRGAILNVASTAAFQPMPGTATYAATKAFVLSLSEGTHAELKGMGVTVTALCPGPVKTEFADVAGIGGAEDSLPDLFWSTAEDVAKAAVAGLESGKRVVVPGVLNRATAVGGQHMPRALALPLIKRVWGAAGK
jgi:short-subunit dehydrogenase